MSTRRNLLYGRQVSRTVHLTSPLSCELTTLGVLDDLDREAIELGIVVDFAGVRAEARTDCVPIDTAISALTLPVVRMHVHAPVKWECVADTHLNLNCPRVLFQTQDPAQVTEWVQLVGLQIIITRRTIIYPVG